LRLELTCGEDGSEQVAICSDEPKVRLPPVTVAPGTIRQCIGPERWDAFLRLRKLGVSRMFVDAADS
jgi:hypothetical protein